MKEARVSIRDEMAHAQTLMEQQRFRSSIAQLELLLERCPEHTAFLAYNLANLYHRQVGDGEKARAAYDRCLTGLELSEGVVGPGALQQIEANACENLMLLSLSYDEYEQRAARLESFEPQNPILFGQRPKVRAMRDQGTPWFKVMLWLAESFRPDLNDSPFLGGAASIYQLMVTHSRELRLAPSTRRDAILWRARLAINI